MPTAHRHPWHRDSLFGDGPRRPLDREQRARFKFLLNAHRRARRLTPHAELVGNALVRRLSVEGRCDPGHDAIANDAGCCARTVRRALDALKALGLVLWQRRIVRDGWRVAQTSNAYVLVPQATTEIRSICTGGQRVRQTRIKSFVTAQHAVSDVPPEDRSAAHAALARVAAQRQAALCERLANKGRMAAA